MGLLSVPLDLVAIPVGLVLIVVPLRHNDTDQEQQVRMLAGKQVRMAPGGGIRRYCEHLQWGDSSPA